ncbi:MAG: AAA family ATPase, partial [Omnitrophica WOR_2 bacterium]
MGHLHLSLLGPFQAFLDGKPVAGFDSIRTRALLAYLAVESDRPHSRETLAGFLWPDRPQAQAMGSLRTALANLRKAIGDQQAHPPFLLIMRDTLQLNQESDIWVDVEKLSAIGDQQTQIYNLQPAAGGRSPAVDLCRGEFLEGFSLPGNPEFEQWVLEKRTHYREIVLKLLRRTSEAAAQEGMYELSLGYARRILELEPWDEPAHQQAMFLLTLSGERTAALAQYQVCRKLLQDELGAEPSEETTRLYEQILSGGMVTPPGLVFASGERMVTPGPIFVARQKQLERLDAALRRALAGKGQVFFITGGPGSGKTALANEFLRRSLLAHPILAAARGRCQAYFGHGDPYLPFREILEMLTGQMEEHYEAGMTGQEANPRLWRSSTSAVQAIVEEGPALVQTFLSGVALLKCANQFVQGQPAWLERLGQLVRYRQGMQGEERFQQEALFSQYVSVLRALARRTPLILFLDDLQWADLGSLGLLFALGRGIQGARILIVGAYRAEEVHSDAAGNRHPLAGVANEFRLLFPDSSIDLDEVEDTRFVDALLDSQLNCLGQAFREQLFRHTRGHPLFTIELLRGMQERGDLAQDETGRWMESS